MAKLSDISIIAWLMDNEIKTETGDAYDLVRHRFWFDVLSDLSPNHVWLKAAQTGGTLAAILKKFWVVKNVGLNAIYTMPTSGDVRDFVNGKVNPMIDHNDVLQDYVKDKDTIEQKRVGDHTIYYRGTWTSRQALSVTSDLNIHDEEDRSDQAVVSQYASRQQHSDYGWSWHFSNPSVPGNGVDKYWKKSDKKHWFITCSRCKKKQYLSWPDSINRETKEFICKKCKKPLRDEDRLKGSWHAQITQYEPKYSGYWISLLMAPWVTAGDIVDKFESDEHSEEYFYNFVLGLPYVGSGATVTEQMIFQNLTSKKHTPKGPISIGVDTGAKIYWTAMNKEGIFDYGECDDYQPIERMIKKYGRENCIVVMDQGGDIIRPRQLRNKYRGLFYLCHYRRDRKTYQLIRWGDGEERGNVKVDRNRMIQLCIDELADKRVPIFGNKDKWWGWWQHWDNIYRTTEENSLGVEEKKWMRSGADHWCFTGDTLVTTRESQKKIKDVEVGDEAWTRDGYKKVIRSGLVDENAKTVTVLFSDGTKLTATPDHKVWSKEENKFKPLHSFSYGDKIETYKNNQNVCLKRLKQSSSTTSSLEDIQNQKAGQKESITRQVARTVKTVWVGYTKRFGKTRMVKFLKDMLSTTKTVIRSTMTSTILNVCHVQNISRCIQKSGIQMARTGKRMKRISIRYENSHTNGGVRKKAKNGIVSMLMSRYCEKSLRFLNAMSVAMRAKHYIKEKLGFADQSVVLVGMHENGEKDSVYNLTIEDKHEYYANGVLVANCHSYVYARVGMDKFGMNHKPQTVEPDKPKIIGVEESFTIEPDFTTEI